MSDRDEEGPQNQQDEKDQQSGRNQQRQNEGPTTAEKVLTGISVAFTVLLFSFVAWQAIQPPGGTHPQVEVVETDESANGSVLVRVELTNPGDEGLISATVEANCQQPPPDATFEYVPAGGYEQGILVCPPGTTGPNVSVSSWVPT